MKKSETTELVMPAPDTDFILELLAEEYPDWVKAKRSGDMSRQMRDARQRMDALLDEYLEEKESDHDGFKSSTA